jgi:outer membrane protein assembly factor BamA
VEKRNGNFDIALSTLGYNSREGWTFNGQATLTFGDNQLTAIGLSNADDLVERYSGIRARYDRLSIGSSRFRAGIEFDSFRTEFNNSTTLALSDTRPSLGAGAYRSRLNVEPSATFILAEPLTLTVGTSFETVHPEYPGSLSQSANAAFGTLRFHQHWDTSDTDSHDLDAAYRLRSSLRGLGSDTLYTKHAVQAKYLYKHEHESIEVAVMAGMIYGRAPLFERFVLGNSATLRGWSKFDVAPLGGNRAIYGSVTYGYHIMRVFYDTGSVWDSGKGPDEKHSAGVGVSSGLGLFGKNAVLVAVAFPIRNGHVDPVFIAGMSF